MAAAAVGPVELGADEHRDEEEDEGASGWKKKKKGFQSYSGNVLQIGSASPTDPWNFLVCLHSCLLCSLIGNWEEYEIRRLHGLN